MKKTFYFLILGLLILPQSCKLFKLLNSDNEKIVINKNKSQKFILDENGHIFIDVSVNDTIFNFYFDTHGANLLFENNPYVKDSLKPLLEDFLGARGATKQRIKSDWLQIDTAYCNIFSAQNLLVVSIPLIDHKYHPCEKLLGMIGPHIFWYRSENDKKKKILEINYDNTELTVLSEIPQGYTLVKSKFSLGKVDIFLNIDGHEYKFGFDTGYFGSILFSSSAKDKYVSKLPNSQIEYGNLFAVLGGIAVNDTIFVKDVKNIKLNENTVLESSKINFINKDINVVGNEFLMNYNWVIDYENKKLYVKERSTPVKELEHFFYKNINGGISTRNEQLIVKTLIVGGKMEKAGFQINDKILTINNQDITKVSFCDRNDYLKDIIKKSDKLMFVVERNGKKINLEI